MGFVVTRGAEEVFGGTVVQRLSISIGKLSNMIVFFFAQVAPAFELDPALRAH